MKRKTGVGRRLAVTGAPECALSMLVACGVPDQAEGHATGRFALDTRSAQFPPEAESLIPELLVSWEEGDGGTCTTRLEEVIVSIDADAHVESGAPDQNHGGAASLLVDSAPRRYETYLRFDTRGIRDPIRRAELRLYAFDGSSNGPMLALTAEGTSWVFGSFAGTQRFGPFDLTAQGNDTGLLRLSP